MDSVIRYMLAKPVPSDPGGPQLYEPACPPFVASEAIAEDWSADAWARTYGMFKTLEDAEAAGETNTFGILDPQTPYGVIQAQVDENGSITCESVCGAGGDTDSDPDGAPWTTHFTPHTFYQRFGMEPPWCADALAMKMARRGFRCAVTPLNSIPGAQINDERRQMIESVMRASFEEVAERCRISDRSTTIPDDAACFFEKMREAGHAIEVFPDSELADDTSGMSAQDLINHMERRGNEVALYLSNRTEQTAAEVYTAFGMDPAGMHEVSDGYADHDDDPMNDNTQRPSAGPSLG